MSSEHNSEQVGTDPHAPYRVFKSDISYFSGKLEAYLRYKSVPITVEDASWQTLADIGKHTGFRKMPAVQTADNLWLFDTTPMLQWFEQQYPKAPILPDDEALTFLNLLVEDYADEWLWRPAMWWRWVPKGSRWLLGWRIAGEFLSSKAARPGGWLFGWRQSYEWLWNDGMTRQNSATIRDMLFREFEFLEPLLAEQAFLFGSHPSAADFGYFASMFRHFGNDPESAEVMRRQAPHTYEWVARMWNVKANRLPEIQSWQMPNAIYWQPLLRRISQDYLPYLQQNAFAHKAGQKRFNYSGETLTLNNTKTTTYRVWCREVLQRRYLALSEEAKQQVDAWFVEVGGLDCLLQDGIIDSGLNESLQLPVNAKDNSDYRVSLFTLLMGQPRN